MIIAESINNISIIDLLNKNEVPAKNIIFEQYELIKLIFFEASCKPKIRIFHNTFLS